MKNLLLVAFLFSFSFLNAQAPNTDLEKTDDKASAINAEKLEEASEEELMVLMAEAGAQQGDPGAMAALGMFHYLGIYVDTVPNYELAYEWLQKAAKQNEPVAMYFLGKIYQDGIVVPQDLPLAFKWFRKAARYEMPLSYLELAFMYQNGNGVKANTKKAEKWFTMACIEGFDIACEGLVAVSD